jgi:PAS domain S-box-containing protein
LVGADVELSTVKTMPRVSRSQALHSNSVLLDLPANGKKAQISYFSKRLEAAPDPMIMVNKSGLITMLNTLANNMLGYTRDDLIGKEIFRIMPLLPKGFLKNSKVRKIGADLKLFASRKDGKEFPVEISISPVVVGDEIFTWISLRGIADRRQVEEEIKKRQAYTRGLIEASLDPLVTISPEGKITDVNEALVRAIGVEREKIIGTDFADYFTEPKKAREGYQQVFAKGYVADSPLTLRHKNGKLTDVLYNATVYKDDAGNVLGMLATARDITQVKQTSQYARSLIEASLDPLVTISTEGKITDVNEALVRATGVEREKIIGTDFSDYFTEPEKAREGYQQVFANGFVADSPLTLRHKNGKLTDVLYNATVYKDDIGNVLGMLATARDITQVKRTSQYARSLIEASLDPLVTISTEGKITDVNEALVKATGVEREKIIGTDFSDYFTEPEKAREGYQQVFAQGFVADSPLTLRHKNGKLTDVLYNATVYKDNSGNVLGMLATARDITQVKRTSQYARSLIEASLDPLVTISTEGKITDVNEALVKATGVGREKIIGTDFSDYFTEPEKAREGYQQVFAKGFVANSPLTLRHKNGKLTDVLYNATVYKDDAGNVLGMLATARDITAQRKQEVKIKTLNEELEQRIIELESFSYSVSHDLRAPLRAIDGFIAIFLNKYLEKVDQEGQRLLSNVRRNVNKMGSLIDELLTLSRIGMKDIQITTINMNELVNTVLEELYEMRGKANVTIGDLGKAQGDIALIKQALVNLLSNAFKYSYKKENPRIEIGCNEGDKMNYYIKDNGVGFDMEYSNKLFGVFQRLHDPQEYQGIGVGLAIVKRIITRHGGQVWAEGKEGEGATFYFSLNTAI